MPRKRQRIEPGEDTGDELFDPTKETLQQFIARLEPVWSSNGVYGSRKCALLCSSLGHNYQGIVEEVEKQLGDKECWQNLKDLLILSIDHDGSEAAPQNAENSAPQQEAPKKSIPRRSGRCFNCGSKNHRRWDCDVPLRYCRQCNTPGHMKVFCNRPAAHFSDVNARMVSMYGTTNARRLPFPQAIQPVWPSSIIQIATYPMPTMAPAPSYCYYHGR